jgi:hypothetical protein
MATERAAKQVAQECAMKAAYYRREFTQRAWRETILAALLIPLGLILLLPAPATGFLFFICGAVVAHEAYTSFQYARTVYGKIHGSAWRSELKQSDFRCAAIRSVVV